MVQIREGLVDDLTFELNPNIMAQEINSRQR